MAMKDIEKLIGHDVEVELMDGRDRADLTRRGTWMEAVFGSGPCTPDRTSGSATQSAKWLALGVAEDG